MPEIDIDRLLAETPDGSEHWIEIIEKSLFAEPPRFKVRIALREQKRLLDRSIRSTVTMRRETDSADTPQEMNMIVDFFAIGHGVLPYIVDWQGFKGAFDRDKVKRFFDAYPHVCEAVGRTFNEFLKTVEKAYIERADAVKKT
jgi:hypothetical protein